MEHETTDEAVKKIRYRICWKSKLTGASGCSNFMSREEAERWIPERKGSSDMPKDNTMEYWLDPELPEDNGPAAPAEPPEAAPEEPRN